MGQAAGLKRRKRRTGNYNVLKNRKYEHRKQLHLKKAGLDFLGLEGADNGQCLLTRIEDGGLVANLKKFQKIDPKMFIRKSQEKPKKLLGRRSAVSLSDNLEKKRASEKKRKHDRRNIKLPNTTVKLLSYYLDRYGEDYKAMVRDARNYDQATEKQLFRSIQSFKSSTQFIEYLKDRGLLPTNTQVKSGDSVEEEVEEEEQEESEDDDEESESEGDDEEQRQQEKLRSKIAEMEKASKQMTKQLTSRPRKAKVMTEDFEVMEEDEDESTERENSKEEAALRKKQKKNILKRNRTKKFKKAKQKRLLKEIRKSGV